jgi:hypothetical protein
MPKAAEISAIRISLALLGVALLGILAASAAPAYATQQRSGRVAIVLGTGTASSSALQTTGVVVGAPEDSFEQFTFTDLTEEELQPGSLAGYDTVVLNQVFTSSLSEAEKQVLSSFVTEGGKLIIHDADGTEGNDYSWLPVPSQTGQSCENCGKTNGEAEVVENNSLISGEPSSPDYIDVGEFPGNSDAIGDANLLLTEDPRWDVDVRATNGLGVTGLVHAYTSDGGLIIYNGFDDDFLGGIYPSGDDWLGKLWYQELAQQWDPDNLPHSNSAASGGTGPVLRCGRETLKVGVVSVCASKISGSGTALSATGNVVLDAGVSVGNGPIAIDTAGKQLSSGGAAPIQLLRSHGSSISLGSTVFTIEAGGTTDPISGKTGLAKILLTSANLAPLANLRVGNLPFSTPISGSLTMYLDNELDGGLIGAGSLQLPMLGKLQTSGSLSLGFYANSPSPVVALGGAAHFGAVDFGKGWKFTGLDLYYQQPSDTWTASGGLDVPIASLQASGSVIHGQLDSLQVNIGGQNVPLGDTGFFFSGFGGGFSGLVNGPLKIDASTEGYWGAPKAPVEPFYLDNVTVTLSLGGSVSLDGAVSFVLKNHSPLNGQLHLKLAVNPFSAIGSASTEGHLPGVSLKAGGGVGFTTKHFTATEHGSVDAFGLSGSGEVIASDNGLGASGALCAPFHAYCQSIAFTETWKQLGKFDAPTIAGAEPQRLITVPGVATAPRPAVIRVPAGRTVLLIGVSGSAVAPEVRLRAPGGKVYRSSHSTRTVIFTRQSQFALTTIAVIRPRAGLWRVSAAPGEQAVLHVHAQTVRPLRLIHASAIRPKSSARHPLGPHAHVLLRWSSAGLPKGVKVVLVRRSQPHEPGVGIVGDLNPSDSYAVPVGKLAIGRNYLTLAATLNGVPFQEVTFAGSAWRSAARPQPVRKHHRSKS